MYAATWTWLPSGPENGKILALELINRIRAKRVLFRHCAGDGGKRDRVRAEAVTIKGTVRLAVDHHLGASASDWQSWLPLQRHWLALPNRSWNFGGSWELSPIAVSPIALTLGGLQKRTVKRRLKTRRLMTSFISLVCLD